MRHKVCHVAVIPILFERNLKSSPAMARFGVFLLAAVVATALVTPCLSSLAANFLLPLDNLYDELRDCPVCAGIAPKFGTFCFVFEVFYFLTHLIHL